jgi:hypothetical protein
MAAEANAGFGQLPGGVVGEPLRGIGGRALSSLAVSFFTFATFASGAYQPAAVIGIPARSGAQGAGRGRSRRSPRAVLRRW